MMIALSHLCAPALNHYTKCYPLKSSWSGRRHEYISACGSEYDNGGRLDVVPAARVTLSLGGLEHPRTGCIPLFLPLRKQKRGNTAAEQSYQPNLLTLTLHPESVCSWSRASYDRVSSALRRVYWRGCGSVINITSLFFCRALRLLQSRVHAT